jgi:hypothetical protein
MKGFDTTEFVGKLYTVVVKNEGDRAWPESIIPAVAGAPANGPAAPPAKPTGPPPRKPAAPAVNSGTKYWIDRGEGSETLGHADEVNAAIFNIGKAADVMVCVEGGTEWKPASEYGFADSPIQ